MIVLRNVYKKYKNGTNALYDLNLDVAKGEFIYVIGKTGSGKSTLIKLIDAEEAPTSGLVQINNVDVSKLKRSKIPRFRRSVGVIYQDFKLLSKKTVFENVAFALEVLLMPQAKIRQRVREVLALVDLSEKANSYPSQLSGGQQQRVAIARAIANRPCVLIADEPTGNLDPEKSREIVQLLEKINKEEETTIVMVTHDQGLVDTHKKRTIVLDQGHVVADLNIGGYVHDKTHI